MKTIFTLFFPVLLWASGLLRQGSPANEAPVVDIVAPLKDQPLEREKPFAYKIQVRDKEDGQTRYDEISESEVFLKVKFVRNRQGAEDYLKKETETAPVFRSMKINACFNCHSPQQKMAGPAFRDIFAKYGNSPTVVARLADKIIKGSKGAWSDSQQMPAHPELSVSQATSMTRLVLAYGSDQDLALYTGTEGWIKPQARGVKGQYLLIASYLDHGAEGVDRLEGKQTLLTRPF